MIKNDYSRVKAKRGPNHAAVGFKKGCIKRCFTLLKKRKERVTASKVLRETALKISRKTVHRALSRMRYRYKKAKFTIVLKKKQKQNRVRLCTEWLTKPKNQDEVVFTDEKKIHLDGPDNWCSWMEENHQVYLNKRHCAGGSQMVWGHNTFCQNGNWSNKFRQLHQAYENHCHPFNERNSPRWFCSATRQLQYSCFKKNFGNF